MGEFRMPALGAGMDVGRIVAWHVAAGDDVRRGDVLALVETDKADIDVEVSEDGVVDELLVDAGAKVPVGTPLARIGERAGAAPAASLPATHPNGEVDEHPSVTSPLVRHQPEDARVTLTRGSGPGGSNTRHDREDVTRPLAMRRAIARAMERSNREIPHYHLGETVDVEQTLTWLTERNADRPPRERILPAALVLKATALALRDYGELNGYWIDDAFQPGDGIHLGVAINLRRGGLLAPAIRDADRLSLDELMAALRDLVGRTRSAGLRGSELTDPTVTVSNLGDTGVELIHGVITPPQVALVGVGRITERPWAVDGMLAVRRTVFVSLAGDHRASDGHRGGRFLAAVAANLTRPETL